MNYDTDIPHAHSKPIKVLQVHKVAIRLKKLKKPKLMVREDRFPDLDFLPIPLTAIYNDISIIIILKTRTPEKLNN